MKLIEKKQKKLKYFWYNLTTDNSEILLIQFCISTDFVYTQLNVKTVLY